MAYFAQINENNYVTNVYSVNNSVIIENGIENENLGAIFLNNVLNNQIIYKRTSYNTLGGIHYTNGQPSIDQSKAFRKNYAGIGYYYDNIKDAFIPPKPYPSWVLDEFSCLWNPPISYPNDGNNYYWNEETLNWELII